MNIQRKAFTMIELVFVIVILGILASVAISKMAVTRDDAMFVKGKAQVAAIRNSLALLRSTNMLQARGAGWLANLDDATTAEGQELFDGDTNNTLLDYPVISKNSDGSWMKTTGGYDFRVMNTTVPFTYDSGNGRFTCSTTTGTTAQQKYCKTLIH